jgi:hypothetical protein
MTRWIAAQLPRKASLALAGCAALVGIEEERLRLRRSWIARMGKALPPRKLARYFQLESKLEAVVRADLAQQILLVP